MTNEKKLNLKTTTFIYPMLIVLAIWMVLWVELTFHYNFDNWGIRPRTLIGLRGIIFAPFIHGGVKHALSNTLPFLLLGMALFYFYERIAWKILIYGALLTGFLTWLIGRGYSTHIGASGVIYVLFSFLLFKGIFSKNYRLIALSLIIVFVYGGLIWGMFPRDPHISWEGHLSGFISGIVFAVIYRHYKIESYHSPVQKTAISKREAEFLSHFDKTGNFIPTSEMKKKEETTNQTMTKSIEVIYHYAKKENDQKERKSSE